MPVPRLSRQDMVAISRREEHTEERLDKALEEIARLKARNKELRAQLAELRRK